MIATPIELLSVLSQYNPWWKGGSFVGLPDWRRAAFGELIKWISDPPAPRAVLLTGARQVGKTTLLLQAAQHLIARGIRPEQILYVTFDHPLMKLVGLEGVLKLWREIQPPPEGVEYLLLDEIQYTDDWATWLKHQADFHRNRKIAVTGSSMPLATETPESGVVCWHVIKLPTLSFFEYLQIKGIPKPRLPEVPSLRVLTAWTDAERVRVGEAGRDLVPHFHEYLVRGGFPQAVLAPDVTTAQRLVREDIVDKVLKRDMTAIFGVRLILELEKTFLYLCLHDGGMLDIPTLSRNLGLNKQTVNNFIELFQAAHLIYKLPPYGYGKEVLRAKYKLYMADAAIPGSVLLRGRSLLEDQARLGGAVETAFFKHVITHLYQVSVGFSYWRGSHDREVDIVAEVEGRLIPFEIKYTGRSPEPSELGGLRLLCEEKRVQAAYVITREPEHFKVLRLQHSNGVTDVLLLPAPLACYWLSQIEHRPIPASWINNAEP